MTDTERVSMVLERLEQLAQECETVYQRVRRYGFHEDRAKAYLDMGLDLKLLIASIKGD